MRKLALLDVDGTLTDTVAVDLRCFLVTLSELFGFSRRERDYDWAAIPHATDPGLLAGAFDQFAGRPPTAAESAAFVKRFLAALAVAAEEKPADFRPIGGAREVVAALAAAPGWSFAIATGCWAESARLKLEVAGFDEVYEPLASASDAVAREEIFGLARERAASRGVSATVLVGDGTWDAVTARNLGLSFIGIGTGERAAALRRLGAVRVLPDFHDLDAALDAMAAAAAAGG